MSLCASWVPADEVDAFCPCNSSDFDEPEQLIRWQLVASSILYGLSGRRFPGVCSDSVRPCSRHVLQTLGYVTAGGSRPIVLDGVALLDGGCSGAAPCGAHGSVLLPHHPVRRIVEVRVAGVPVDPSLYKLVDRRWLVRASGSWPCSQNLGLADGEPDTWSVDYEYGIEPPAGGKEMAAIYGCELAKGCANDASCRLPRRVQTLSREGVSMTLIDPFDFIENGGTGLYEVDEWLRAVNPGRLDRAGKILNPDLIDTHRVR